MLLNIDGGYSGIRFSACHFIPRHEKCSRLHGHSYIVRLELEGDIGEEGMIMDFVVLKKKLKEIIEVQDDDPQDGGGDRLPGERQVRVRRTRRGARSDRLVQGGALMPKAVVLLSGGLDSTTCLAQAIADGCEVTAISFRYGQRHTKELTSAQNVCDFYNVDHVVIDLDLSSFRSALTRKDIDVPMDREGELDAKIPITYVPARNIVFLSIAAGLCESVDADRIYIGANSVDFSGYPDCTPAFYEAFQAMLAVGTKAGVEGNPIQIVTPILHDSPLHLTWSCYNGGEKACGHCDSCRLRLQGFKEAGFRDEIEYEHGENLL